MEGFRVFNGLECKIACNSSKVSCIKSHVLVLLVCIHVLVNKQDPLYTFLFVISSVFCLSTVDVCM
jgi:hypothetical protein